MLRASVLALLLCSASAASPVQKVVELLDEMKGKVQKDLAAEEAAMNEYTTYCHEEIRTKDYAIKDAAKELAELNAKIADGQATLSASEDDISSLGNLMAEKEKELMQATSKRDAEKAVFVSAEKTLLESIKETEGAVASIKQVALVQGGRMDTTKLEQVKNALDLVLKGFSNERATKRQLRSFLQASTSESESDGLDLEQALRGAEANRGRTEPSQAGTDAILEAIQGMEEKAKAQLSELRKSEQDAVNAFQLLEAGIKNELKNAKKKFDTATKLKAASTESVGEAQGDLGEVSKSKADDEAYSETMKQDCQTKAAEWEERQRSAGEEMAAIDKAKEILVSGVTVLLQTGARHTSVSGDDRRTRVAAKLRSLGRKYHSFGLVQLASKAASDPFVKIRGLIEDMIAKLMKEAEEEATHEAFCDTEMGKSKTTQKEKTTKLADRQIRIDKATATIAELSESVKTLETQVAEIDKAQKEATAIRQEEKADNTQCMTDFGQSAEAVNKAIGVLKSYYEGESLLQVQVQVRRAGQPSFGSAKGEAGASIISILEMAESDFTRMHAECEADETKANDAYKKLTQENKVSKSSKLAEAKAKATEVKGLEVDLSDSKEDHAAVSSELDAVNNYIEKLKPECETKTMTYAEKKAAREAEIEGLKEALGILEGKDLAMLLQSERQFRAPRSL